MTKNVIMILGMHRSGTSVLARLFSILGGGLPKTLLGSNEGNKKGHWESETLIAKNDALLADMGSSWDDFRLIKPSSLGYKALNGMREDIAFTLAEEYAGQDNWVLKEPRICRLTSFYFEALKDQNVKPHVVISLRNPLEVAESLRARDAMPLHMGLLLWLTHMLEAERVTRDMARSFVHYEDLLAKPYSEMTRLTSEIEMSLPYSTDETKDQLERFVTPDLKRQRRADEDLRHDILAQSWAADSYSAFQVLRNNKNSEPALATLDKIRTSYYPSIDFIYDILTDRESEITSKEAVISAKTGLILEQKAALIERDEVIAERGLALEERDGLIADKEALLIKSYATASEKEDALKERDDIISGLEASLAERDKVIAERGAALKERDDLIANKESLLVKSYASMSEKEAALIERDKIIAERGVALEERDIKISQQDVFLAERGAIITAKEAAISRQESELKDKEQAIDALDKEISHMRDAASETLDEKDQALAGLQQRLNELELTLSERDAHIGALNSEVQMILNSSSWKMTSALRRVLNVLKGSKAPVKNVTQNAPPPRLTFDE